MYLVVNKSGEFYVNTTGTFILTFITYKEEDKNLNKIAKTKHSDNYLEVINKDYKDAGIEIAKWSED